MGRCYPRQFAEYHQNHHGDEGSGDARTMRKIQSACPKANVLKAFAMRGKTAQNSCDAAKRDTLKWLGGGTAVSWDRTANGFRLPTEAEWEYAARAGTTTLFYSRKVPGADDVNFYGHYPYQIAQNYFNDSALETRPGVYRGKTVAVGSFSANPNGLYDIYGNVDEWCFDFYGDYVTAAQTNPTGAAAGTRRVNRGA